MKPPLRQLRLPASSVSYLGQIIRFLSIGFIATVVHISIYLSFVSLKGLAPLSANIAAYCPAFAVAFLCNRYWTFRESQLSSPLAFFRFLCISLLGLGSNLLITLLVTDILNCPAAIAALGMLIVTPPATFIASKYWAFGGQFPPLAHKQSST